MPNTKFPYQPHELSAFTETIGIFIISLKNGEIVRHNPDDRDAFHRWLLQNNVRDINAASKN